MRKVLGILGLGLGAVVAVTVLITIGAVLLESNPAVRQEPPWDTPQTKALAQRACYDCHSNETVWPLYAKLPFASWLVVFDTYRGRRNLNFSEWQSPLTGGRGGNREREAAEVITAGSMPPSYYTLMHPEAILTAQEKQQLILVLQQSLR